MNQRLIAAAQALLLGTGCAASARVGGQFRAIEGQPVGEAQFTLGGGLGTADSRVQILFPTLSVSSGEQLDGDGAESALEVGMEASVLDENFGVRISPRVGAGLFGTTGAYLGLRAGPQLILSELREDEWTPSLTLEGLAAVGLGGEAEGAGIFGASLSVGCDLYGGFHIAHGRPLRDARGVPWQARLHPGAMRSSECEEVRALAPEQRTTVGQAWLEEARGEHSSIASFVRLARELQRLGAPLALTLGAYRAASEEVQHARDCFALAARYLGRTVTPEPLPPAPAREALSHEGLALECWLDGCLGEGTAANLATRRAERTYSPVTRRALQRIARDEAGHAELAWQIVAWCMKVRPRSAAAVLRSTPVPLPQAAEPAQTARATRALASHGLFTQEDVRSEHAHTYAVANRRLRQLCA